MRTVILYGELRKRFGREHRLAVKTASEAIKALCANFPEMRSMMRDAHRYSVGFAVKVGKVGLERERDASLPSSSDEVIRIAPMVFGSGGVLKALIGAVLIVGGIIVTGLSFGAAAPIGQAMIGMGISLALSGVYELLASPPPGVNAGGVGDGSQSYIFSGPENVTQQGGAVPVGYGRNFIGSTVISAGIEDSDQ